MQPSNHKALSGSRQSPSAGCGAELGSSGSPPLDRAPRWEAADLGHPLPDSEHACSVALPRWEHVVGYEEEDPAILGRLQCGYPRFVWNRHVEALRARCEAQFAGPDRCCLVFPSAKAAVRCARYIRDREGGAPEVREFGPAGIHAVVLAEAHLATGKAYWRYSGEIVSSRQASAALREPAVDTGQGQDVKQVLRERLAKQTGQRSEDVFLFPSGMAALFHVHRMVCSVAPGLHSAQLEFPYVDVLKVQREFGDGVHFYPRVEAADLAQLERTLRRRRLNAVFCEIPSNPLMRSVDLLRVAASCAAYDTPLVVDDTIASSANVDAFRCADVVTTSLTKWFSGTGDVMGGSVVVRTGSPFRDAFASFLQAEADDDVWGEDAAALEANSRDYPERMARVNQTGEAVYDFLAHHPRVERVAYPASVTPEAYGEVIRPGGGYGGLMSVVLRNGPYAAPRFYDALRVSKGPSLGTNFTLACPYTLLAHYRELDWAESCGVPRHLIRLSVGLEPADDLVTRLDEALHAV